MDAHRFAAPRVLLVTPEIAGLPPGMIRNGEYIRAKASTMGDAIAAMAETVWGEDLDLHIAIPHFRSIFQDCMPSKRHEIDFMMAAHSPQTRLHLAEDRSFFYQNHVYDFTNTDREKFAIAFQREVVNEIIPRVRPDIIHCHGWMTGLIPAFAQSNDIACLFSVYHNQNAKITMGQIDDIGIDTKSFWRKLYFSRMPSGYAESRDTNPVDLLASGIFSASTATAIGPDSVADIETGQSREFDPILRQFKIQIPNMEGTKNNHVSGHQGQIEQYLDLCRHAIISQANIARKKPFATRWTRKRPSAAFRQTNKVFVGLKS